MEELEATLNEHAANEAELAAWWKEDAARLDELGGIMREMGVIVPMPSAEDVEAAAAVEAAPDWPARADGEQD